MISGQIQSVFYTIDGKELPTLIDTISDGRLVEALIGKHTFSHLAKRKDKEIDHVLYLYIPGIETSTVSVETMYGEFGIVIDSSSTVYDKKWTVLMLVYYKEDIDSTDSIKLLYIDPVTELAKSTTIRYDVKHRQVMVK